MDGPKELGTAEQGRGEIGKGEIRKVEFGKGQHRKDECGKGEMLRHHYFGQDPNRPYPVRHGEPKQSTFDQCYNSTDNNYNTTAICWFDRQRYSVRWLFETY